MTPAERIDEVLRYTKMNVKTLSERLGYARPQGLYDVAAGRTKNISPDLARKIITAFPEIRQAWLLSGEGDMLRMMPDPKLMKTVDQESVAITSAEVRELISQNGKLIDIIRELTKKQSI